MAKNGMMKRGEAINYLQGKHPARFKDSTFQNDLNAKNIKPTKRVRTDGNKLPTLLFSKADLNAYSQLLAERYGKRKGTGLKMAKAVRAKATKGPTKTFSVPIAADKLEILLSVFTQEQLQQKLSKALNETATKIQSKLNEIETKKKKLLEEIKGSINL